MRDDYVVQKLKDVLVIINDVRVDSTSWTVLYEIIRMEIRLLCPDAGPRAREVKGISKINGDTQPLTIVDESRSIDILSSTLKSINLEETDAIGFELISRMLCLAVQYEVSVQHLCRKQKQCSVNTDAFSSSSILLIESVSASCLKAVTASSQTSTSNLNSTTATEGKYIGLQNSNKYITFLARIYNSCLSWIQQHFQNKTKDKIIIENGFDDLHIQHIAGDLITLIFKSFISSNIWIHDGLLILVTLRAIGKCLSHQPLGSFEGILGVNICNGLSDCISDLIVKLYTCKPKKDENNHERDREGHEEIKECGITADQKKEIVSTLQTLTSLISSKCITSKLYATSCSLLVSAFLALDRIEMIGHNPNSQSHIDHSQNMHKDQKIPKLFLNDKEDKAANTGIIDMNVFNRHMSSLIISCVHGVIDDVTDDVINSNDSKLDINQNGNDVLYEREQKRILKEESSSTMMFNACQPMLRSTYGPEFFYSLCAEFILHLENSRSHVSSSSQLKSSNNAINFIEKLSQSSAGEEKITSKESTIMDLYIRSHSSWAVSLLCGASDLTLTSASLIESLKILGDKIDPHLMDTVAAVKGKGRSKRPLKAEKDKNVKDVNQIVPAIAETMKSYAGDLRVCILLALWGLPLSYSQVPNCFSRSYSSSYMKYFLPLHFVVYLPS